MAQIQAKPKDTVWDSWNYSLFVSRFWYLVESISMANLIRHQIAAFKAYHWRFLYEKRCQLGSKLCLVFWAWKKLKEHAVVLSILYQMLEGKSFQFRKRWKHKHKNNFTELYRLFALNKFDDGRVWPFVQKGSPEMGKNPKLFAKFHNQWCDNLYFVGMF